MVELFQQDIRTNDRQSSKGNQLKWENNGYWYKADYTGYEGLAEYIVSHLLQKTDLRKQEFVLYDLETIKYKSTIYNGVKSENFLGNSWQIITLERLFYQFYNQSLYKSIYKIRDHTERMKFLVEQVERITGLKGFGIYMDKLMTIDAIFLNEDRHMHNIAVLMNGEGAYDYCPIFDHGAGLLSDTTMDYPLSGKLEDYLEDVQAKTICGDFEEQMDIAQKLYPSQIRFRFDAQDVEKLLTEADQYPKEVRARVESILRNQIRKYQYLFH